MNGFARLVCLLAALWCVAACGCSSGGGRNVRPVPLPAGVDPSDLFNTRTETMPPADATAFYKKDRPDTGTAVSKGTQDVKRDAQEVRDRTIPSETREADFAAAKKRQQEQAGRKEAVATAKAEQRKVETKATATKTARALGVTLNQVMPAEEMMRMLERNTGVRIPRELDSEQKLVAEQSKAEAQVAAADAPPPTPGAKYDLLLLSGGGSQAAYAAGIMCGWTDSGCRPRFDVVTGVSGGALVAAVAFPGCEFDADLRRFFTGIRQRKLRGDVWNVKLVPPLGLGTDSVASNAPLRKIVQEVMANPTYFEKVAAEHAAGRRLYIGTTNLDTQRFVVWDMGAIATEGTPEARKLYLDIVMASAAIPPLLTPGRLAVTIDGRRHEELHVDGGITRNIFFYPPADWPGKAEDEKTDNRMLAGARVYAVVSGQLYNEPAGTNPKVLSEGVRVLGTVLSSLQRAELARIYARCRTRDMVFHLAAIPPDFPNLFKPTEFDPADMTRLFDEGYNRIREGRVWNQESPERAVSEDRARRSAALTTTGSGEIGPVPLAAGRPGVATVPPR